MRQLQVLDEAGRLDVVGMGDDEFLVLRRGGAFLAELVGPERPVDQAIAIALRSDWPKTSP